MDLKLKDGSIKNLKIRSAPTIKYPNGCLDGELILKHIRHLMDDRYEVTEEIKQEAIEKLRIYIHKAEK